MPRTSLLRALTVSVVFVVVLASPACEERGPSPQWVTARAAYDQAMADPASGYLGARWDEALRLLHAVPDDNGAEHRRARALISEIEGTRATMAAQLHRGETAAEKLLDLPSFPVDATFGASPSGAPAREAADTPICRARCQDTLWKCLSSNGCTRKGANVTCEGDAAPGGARCRLEQLECEKACDGVAAATPPCSRCDEEANACFLALGTCSGSGVDFTCRPGVEDGEAACRNKLKTCRARCR